MKSASFSLMKYSFDKVLIDYTLKVNSELSLNFEPKGVFKQEEDKSIFELTFTFTSAEKGSTADFINIECNATFVFAEQISFKEIPSYFYANSIAILFPYIRAFISTVTLQANYSPFVLPTMNLSSLEEPLKRNTIAE